MSKRSRSLMAERLPTKADFISHCEDLDQICAWKHFGGLTLDEAKMRFAENPLYFQEDFMFMGTKAFLFYFPVLEDHLRSIPDGESEDDWESWIIAQCIRAQLNDDTIVRLRPIVDSIVKLAGFVRDNVRRFGCDDAERQRVADAWVELVHHIETLGNAQGEP